MKEHGFKQRLFAPLKGRKMPKVMLFTDTETKAEVSEFQEIHKFSLGWIFTWESDNDPVEKTVETEYFDDHTKYCQHFEDQVNKYKTVHIYGHNIFFDLQCAGFFEYFTAQGWGLEWLYDKGLTYILRIIKGSLKIMFLTSTN